MDIDIDIDDEEEEEEEEIDDESGEGDDMGDLGDDDDEEEGDDADDDDEDIVIDEIVEQFTRTFHNGDYDREFDDALSFDRGAISPDIRPTQESYNKPDDWRERNRSGLTNLKRQLQSCIDSLAPDLSGSFDLRLGSNSRWGQQQLLRDNEEPIVWHEPILDEYWGELEAEIHQQRQQEIVTDITCIQITNVEIKKERLAALVAIFRSGRATNSSTHVNFNNANICGEGIIYLSKLVDVSSQLHTFYLRYNRIDNMESARCLSRSLKTHTRIDQLWLTHCDLGSNPEILSVILQSDIKHIDIENNNIDSLGAVQIAEYLESNPPIRRIDLGHNHLNDNDAIFLSRALKRNTNLTAINMHSNNFTSIGVKALLTCVFDSSSLNAISESNHTLTTIEIVHCRYVNMFIYRLLQLDRTQKIVLALLDNDSLIQYLAHVPVGLISEVLAFPHGRVADLCPHKCFSIVYSTMRWWNMPMLYSYHCCVKSDTKRKRTD